MSFLHNMMAWFSVQWDTLLSTVSGIELSIQSFADAFVQDVPSLLILFLLVLLSASVHLLSRYTKTLKMTVAELRKAIRDLQ